MSQKLISNDISPDPGVECAISSDSAAPSTEAYCPLMGNLQGKFDFFIKTQQPKDEKNHLPPRSPPVLAFAQLSLLKCHPEMLPPHFSPISCLPPTPPFFFS